MKYGMTTLLTWFGIVFWQLQPFRCLNGVPYLARI